MIDQTQEAPALYSKETLESWILSIPTTTREKLIESNCGTSSGYVLKRVYTRNYDLAPTFKLRIALGLDKASQGRIDFRDLIEGSEEIDWSYIHKMLGRRLREEAAAAKSEAEQPAV